MDERDLDPDPIRQFSHWYDDAIAAGVPQADAFALATATADGHPSARMLLLKGHGERGFVFFSNRESRKGRELAANGHAALLFFWQPLRRQVRVEGDIQLTSDEETAAYFATRPRGSQVAAWASPQSRPVASRAELDRLRAEADARLRHAGMTPPPFWGGYLLVPGAVEFWQGRDHRLHDRVRYERGEGGWTRFRLAP